jgi:hypothetical protein
MTQKRKSLSAERTDLNFAGAAKYHTAAGLEKFCGAAQIWLHNPLQA